MIEIPINSTLADQRLDIILVKLFPNVSRSKLKKWITNKNVLINGYNQRPSYVTKNGEKISISLPEPEKNKSWIAQNLKLNIVYQDKSILVVDKSGNYGDADGIITSPLDNLVLLIKTADCIPIFIYDNITRNYGIVHAGWRGVKKKIHLKAIEKFIGLGSHKNNLNFVMGPSIKACCYEVGAEMRDFVNIGIVKDKIKIDSICTYENKHLHSFRRDREKSGRMLSVIVNKK